MVNFNEMVDNKVQNIYDGYVNNSNEMRILNSELLKYCKERDYYRIFVNGALAHTIETRINEMKSKGDIYLSKTFDMISTGYETKIGNYIVERNDRIRIDSAFERRILTSIRSYFPDASYTNINVKTIDDYVINTGKNLSFCATLNELIAMYNSEKKKEEEFELEYEKFMQNYDERASLLKKEILTR